jgi:hypothetical protein
MKHFGAVLGAVVMLAAGGSFAKGKDAKLCADLSNFRTSVYNLQNMGPESTVNDLRQSENQVASAGREVAKEAKHDKNAKDLHNAISQLDGAVGRLPPNVTIATAKATIRDQVMAVQDAAQNFEREHCPGQP